MRDIHSIGQAFKIVSGGTAKGRADIKSSDEKNNVEAMTADEFLTSQEFPPQEREILERIDICLNQWKQYKEANVWHCPYDKDKCEEVKQAREETLREVEILINNILKQLEKEKKK